MLFAYISHLKIFPAEHKTVTQIFLTHNLVGRQFLGCALKQDFTFEQQVSRSVMLNVSCTLWSVIRMPMFLSFNLHTICWMSSTAIGSTPAKGSSNMINLGSMAKHRAISVRRRSPLTTGPQVLPDLLQTKFGYKTFQLFLLILFRSLGQLQY